ncbi:MAG: sigma factor [Zavarzinella sp.]
MRTNHPTSKRNLCLSDNSNAPHSVVHESFEADDAYELYQPENAQSLDSSHNYMPDDITRDIAKRMHYAAFRWKRSKGVAESRKWQQAYIALRDQIVLGNRKLVYQAVRRRMAMSNRADDLIGDCQIVLIQAVAAYNPWMGIRFSTYATPASCGHWHVWPRNYRTTGSASPLHWM